MNKYITGVIIGGAIVGLIAFMLSQGKHEQYQEKQNYEQGEHSHEHDDVNKNADLLQLREDINVQPISHASAIINWKEAIIFADPVGDASMYIENGMPDIVFITHRHGDHFDSDNLPAMLSESTTLIAPQDVINQLPQEINAKIIALAPGETATINPLTLEAIAAYNTREEAQNYHPQSRGDIGVVVDDGTTRVYFSGDTEGTPEMFALENIDVAFLSMNLPYTMGVDAAAEAVLEFKPSVVYPYHFRTPEGFSDVKKFKTIVESKNNNIEVIIADWYKEIE